MTKQDIIDLIVKLGVTTSAAAGATFIIAYHLRTFWWKSSIGRHLMSFMAGLTLILFLSFIATFIPGMPGRQEVRAFSWILIPTLMVWRTVIVLRVKRYDSNGNTK